MICVILPCFKTKSKILGVLERIDDTVHEIIVVDDACPESTGAYVSEHFKDPRLKVIVRDENGGVGAAMKTGFVEALKGDCTIFVKIDGDGQMKPEILHQFVKPIEQELADYCKGNRFYNLDLLKSMPFRRKFGNAGLSFLTKLSTGYWNLMDPTNGYLAIHRAVLENIPLEKLDNRYFFETDLLFRAYTVGAVVIDIPMRSSYDDESSNLSTIHSLGTFTVKHSKLFVKRIFYTYFLRDFSLASINFILGIVLIGVGLITGIERHLHFSSLGTETPTGIQLIVLIQILIGFHLFLSFVNFDMTRSPKIPIHKLLSTRNPSKS